MIGKAKAKQKKIHMAGNRLWAVEILVREDRAAD